MAKFTMVEEYMVVGARRYPTMFDRHVQGHVEVISSKDDAEKRKPVRERVQEFLLELIRNQEEHKDKPWLAVWRGPVTVKKRTLIEFDHGEIPVLRLDGDDQLLGILLQED